jgi:small subunit ribosomal protein S7
MPRKFKSLEHLLKPDPEYGSKLVSKFINNIMNGGKKSTAQRAFYDAMAILQKRIPNAEPIDVFTNAVENVKPHIEVRSKRVGGATYQVPMEVNKKRQQALAIRWILDAVRKRSGKPFAQCLADEIMDAFNKDGVAMKNRENIHKMAEANKAFAHFAW